MKVHCYLHLEPRYYYHMLMSLTSIFCSTTWWWGRNILLSRFQGKTVCTFNNLSNMFQQNDSCSSVADNIGNDNIIQMRRQLLNTNMAHNNATCNWFLREALLKDLLVHIEAITIKLLLLCHIYIFPPHSVLSLSVFSHLDMICLVYSSLCIYSSNSRRCCGLTPIIIGD